MTKTLSEFMRKNIAHRSLTLSSNRSSGQQPQSIDSLSLKQAFTHLGKMLCGDFQILSGQTGNLQIPQGISLLSIIALSCHRTCHSDVFFTKIWQCIAS
jgi:hypothetical protein